MHNEFLDQMVIRLLYWYNLDDFDVKEFESEETAVYVLLKHFQICQLNFSVCLLIVTNGMIEILLKEAGSRVTSQR